MDDLLIATWMQVFVRYADGTQRIVLDKNPPFYGLTWNEDALFVAARAWGNTDHDRLHVYDHDFKLMEIQDLPTGAQMHDILWLTDRKCLALTDTATDRLLFWDPGKQEVLRVVEFGQGSDDHHLNSLFLAAERRLLVAGLYGEVWAETDAGFVRTRKVDFQLHNIAIIDGGTYMGASDKESLVVEKEGQTRSIFLTPHMGVTHDASDVWQCYTRGMACSEHYIYVGGAACEHERSERWQGNSAIAVLDRNLEFVEGLHFEGLGAMHCIRVLGMDYAHNGIAWK
jgi:hypothetical protein